MKWFSRQHQKFIWKLDRGQWLRLCWCDCGLWGWSSAGSPQGDLGWLQTTNNHPHPLVLARGFHLSSKIFLLRWKTKVRGRHLRPNFDEKQGTKSWISREEKDFFKFWKSRRERESVLQNLENREEKEKLFYKILKIERRKRSSIQKSCEPRGEREMFSVSVFKILKIERRTRQDISLLQLERGNQE